MGPRLLNFLTPKNGLLFRIIHRANLAWTLANGLHCANSASHDPEFRQIGKQDIISKRARRAVPDFPDRFLSDYVPFYFTPRSLMLLNVLTGFNGLTQVAAEDLLILTGQISKFLNDGIDVIVTDRHALLKTADFRSASQDLTDFIDWSILQTSDFRRDPNDPSKLERYQAEGLAYKHVPISSLRSIVCSCDSVKQAVDALISDSGHRLPVSVQPSWYTP